MGMEVGCSLMIKMQVDASGRMTHFYFGFDSEFKSLLNQFLHNEVFNAMPDHSPPEVSGVFRCIKGNSRTALLLNEFYFSVAVSGKCAPCFIQVFPIELIDVLGGCVVVNECPKNQNNRYYQKFLHDFNGVLVLNERILL